MVGRQTALVDDPQLTVRHIEGISPTRIILDTHRKLPLTLNIFNDNKAKTIVLCSDINFEKSSTSFAEFIPIAEDKEGKLSIYNILDVLGELGICKVLIEGGAELLNSFNKRDLINEIYIYKSNNKLKNANLKNPLIINDNWTVQEETVLGKDRLIVATRKEECLQEL